MMLQIIIFQSNLILHSPLHYAFEHYHQDPLLYSQVLVYLCYVLNQKHIVKLCIYFSHVLSNSYNLYHLKLKVGPPKSILCLK